MNNKKGKKGQIWISALLYILIVTVIMVLVLEVSIPLIEKMEDKGVFTRSKNTFLVLNQHIQDVSDEGAGSQRVLPIEIEKGKFQVKNGALQWNFRTEAEILESGHEIELGDMYISSNSDVEAEETSDTYILRNSYLEVNLTKCETISSCLFDQSNIVKTMTFTDPSAGTSYSTTGTFTVDFGSGNWNATGYSSIEDLGTSLGSASVVYYINNTNNSLSESYTIIEFTLESNSDFLHAKIR